MTKEVIVSITGAHTADGEAADVSVITAGTYYNRNGKHYVIYDEMIDGVEGSIRNTIKIGGGKVDIIKSGGARSHMIFEKEKKDVSCYVTPYGQMMVGINTDEIEIEETENRLFVKVNYTLDINYEELSQCQIVMEIQSKATADFHLGTKYPVS